jgi:hypothetical protein
MRVRVPNKALILLALKLIVGSAAAAMVLLNGTTFGGCPPGAFCLIDIEFYSMRFDHWSGFTALFALGLLLSALKDLLVGLKRFELLERNVESIADID